MIEKREKKVIEEKKFESKLVTASTIHFHYDSNMKYTAEIPAGPTHLPLRETFPFNKLLSH